MKVDYRPIPKGSAAMLPLMFKSFTAVSAPVRSELTARPSMTTTESPRPLPLIEPIWSATVGIRRFILPIAFFLSGVILMGFLLHS